MVKVYTIASGKGGTGKTTVSINLGTMLAKLGKVTYLMDADIGMANVGLILGLQDAPVTLHEILPEKTLSMKGSIMALRTQGYPEWYIPAGLSAGRPGQDP